MPGYMATIVGENFEFVIDGESQFLDFHRTVYVDSANESDAHEAALALIRGELMAQALLDDDSEQMVSIEEIRQQDVLVEKELLGDFVWFFPEEDLFDEDE